ncbi:MAG: hypothetical protein GY777_11705 [Candidatus Brocadiaceae bacterium]|nr:hypothetical protein [Candidatus Brocadiaceae bacterium]
MLKTGNTESNNIDRLLYIDIPNFVFIYTINLGGKIDFYSRLYEQNKRFADINEYFQSKNTFFENLIKNDLYTYTNIESTNLNYFIDKDFLNKAVLSFWKIDRKKYNSVIDNIVKEVNKTCIENRKRICKLKCCSLFTKEGNQLEEELLVENIKVQLNNDIELKLYSSGVIGINFEIGINNNKKLEFLADSCIDLINYPNLVSGRNLKDFYRCDLEGKSKRLFQPGYLAVISYEIANNIFDGFMSSLKENRQDSDLLQIEKIEDLGKNKEEALRIVNRYDKKLYGNKRIDAVPYIGVIMKTLPEWVKDPNKDISDNIIPSEVAKLLSAMASQTKEFLYRLGDADNFLINNNISRGKRDSIIIDKRGFSALGLRKEASADKWDICGKHNDDFYFLQFRLNVLMVMTFCIESTFATMKSVYGFNKELEEFVSKKINILLKDSSYIDAARLAEYVKIISKARTLSPCEDLTSNIIPFLKSHIGIECSKKIKQLGLDELIESSQRRLQNYGHFLNTYYDIQKAVQSEENNNQLKLIAYSLLGIASFIALMFVFLLLK